MAVSRGGHDRVGRDHAAGDRLNDERGSISLVIVAALGFALILGALTADVTRAAAGRARAQAAADAAALAAAQELVLPSGGGPMDAAAEYAAWNGARLISCRCPEGGTEAVWWSGWRPLFRAWGSRARFALRPARS